MHNPLWLTVQTVNFRLDHIQLSGLRVGNPQAPVVLCLHGWLDNAASFSPLFSQLIKSSSPMLSQYQFIAIDWPGHGLSEHRSADAQYHFVDWSYDLLQLINSQQAVTAYDGGSPWQQVHIIGHSMGGMVATTFASAFADKVKSLMLIESIGLITSSQDSSKQLRQGLLSRSRAGKRDKTVYRDLNSAVQARVNVSDLPERCAKLLVERALSENENGFEWLSDHRLRTISAQRFSLAQAIEFTANIQCPVSLVVGSKGFASIVAAIETFASHINDFEQYNLAGGHHPHMESPEDFTELLEIFLKKIN